MLQRKLSLALVAMLLAAVGVAAPAQSAPREDSEWTEYYFPSSDGINKLHADVLRPKGMSPKTKTPVIMTVSPYLNHTGSTTDHDPDAQGPNERFYDFLDLTNILERGYTYVMVDLPGYGASGGCNDWGGPREQAAVKDAVEWAAKQPWSNGKVGLMGKSYDAWTGLMGMAQKPKGLAAVVAMEPVYSGYRYLYTNGVRFLNSVATPAAFQVYDAKPGSTKDDPEYHISAAPQAWCYPLNIGLQQQDEESASHWAERNLLKHAKGSRIPLFLTQGFLEDNTKPDGAFDLFNSLRGPDHRAWYGQFAHVRGWEKLGDRFQTGRTTFVKEMMDFFDHYVKGVPLKKAPTHKYPNVEVQDNFGRYRGEKSWPPSDASMYWNKLKKGTYQDTGLNYGSGGNAGKGIWTFSQTLPHDVWLTGEPKLEVEVTAVPRANLVGNVYDVDPKGEATMISRGAYLLRGAGAQKASFELYGQDWVLRKGHRIGILLSSSNQEWWEHVPTLAPVTVDSAKIGLPFLKYDRNKFLKGTSTPALETHNATNNVMVSKGTVSASDSKFALPKRLARR